MVKIERRSILGPGGLMMSVDILVITSINVRRRYNSQTGESRWDTPAELAVIATSSPRPSEGGGTMKLKEVRRLLL
jgi:hypothetical protein